MTDKSVPDWLTDIDAKPPFATDALHQEHLRCNAAWENAQPAIYKTLEDLREYLNGRSNKYAFHYGTWIGREAAR